jgi:hypothetical protein
MLFVTEYRYEERPDRLPPKRAAGPEHRVANPSGKSRAASRFVADERLGGLLRSYRRAA